MIRSGTNGLGSARCDAESSSDSNRPVRLPRSTPTHSANACDLKTNERVYWNKTFKEAFCEHFGCPPEHYDRTSMAKLFYRHAWPAALLLERVGLESIRGARAFVQRAGQARSWDDLLSDLRSYQSWVDLHGGIWGKRMRIRISGARVFSVASQLFGGVPWQPVEK
jgi:hypothetical protein